VILDKGVPSEASWVRLTYQYQIKGDVFHKLGISFFAPAAHLAISLSFSFFG
jgi:hypothetical protein